MEFSPKTKLILASITVIVSLALGLYTKVMFVAQFYDPFQRWLNLSLYIFSWIMLVIAGFFVGKEALQLADQYVRQKLQESYNLTMDFQKKGIEKSIATTKKGFEKTKDIGKRTIDMHRKILGIDELQFRSEKKRKY